MMINEAEEDYPFHSHSTFSTESYYIVHAYWASKELGSVGIGRRIRTKGEEKKECLEIFRALYKPKGWIKHLSVLWVYSLITRHHRDGHSPDSLCLQVYSPSQALTIVLLLPSGGAKAQLSCPQRVYYKVKKENLIKYYYDHLIDIHQHMTLKKKIKWLPSLKTCDAVQLESH